MCVQRCCHLKLSCHRYDYKGFHGFKFRKIRGQHAQNFLFKTQSIIKGCFPIVYFPVYKENVFFFIFLVEEKTKGKFFGFFFYFLFITVAVCVM